MGVLTLCMPQPFVVDQTSWGGKGVVPTEATASEDWLRFCPPKVPQNMVPIPSTAALTSSGILPPLFSPSCSFRNRWFEKWLYCIRRLFPVHLQAHTSFRCSKGAFVHPLPSVSTTLLSLSHSPHVNSPANFHRYLLLRAGGRPSEKFMVHPDGRALACVCRQTPLQTSFTAAPNNVFYPATRACSARALRHAGC